MRTRNLKVTTDNLRIGILAITFWADLTRTALWAC